MCYNIAGLAYNQFKYAKRMGADEKIITALKGKYDELRKIYEIPEYYANGFAMPHLIVHTAAHPLTLVAMRWRFIPDYIRDGKQLNEFIRKYTTLNVQAEGMWTSPMFKQSALTQRCIVPVGGYFEYFHHNKKKYPYLIKARTDDALLLAGISKQWINQDTGEIIDTLAIVTTKPNETMRRIHNNPAAKSGPRMPLIIREGDENLWLSEIHSPEDIIHIKKAINSYPDELLEYRTVRPLVGKNGTGDSPQAHEKYEYQELKL